MFVSVPLWKAAAPLSLFAAFGSTASDKLPHCCQTLAPCYPSQSAILAADIALLHIRQFALRSAPQALPLLVPNLSPPYCEILPVPHVSVQYPTVLPPPASPAA
ncbi:hypothetical protein COEREDRAFT_81896 [Coemansia reversa NRRL 1564]|uniref:Secreted protein n=1 Tax=Coemansia reversa (strain ATCC 12441 / NRRL 1564) TaxID=763665 RepID=A0A2G5B977_COERN|nr:hypothetical protein COEREDRAFT_81896 [Coemansia reversa NRRL 1564]|eukprot:PIA15569.1 hypothetical protein COEREDRAFT_81896 [Coemansia reversa NRRL 1564]